MDSGFDDLLSSSRNNPVLDNPFEDPFARPSFPDPWLTYSQEPEASDTVSSLGNNEPPQSPSVSEQEPVQHLSELQESPASTTRIPDNDDPLDIKTANQEEPEELLNLPTQHNTPSSEHPSPTISPIAPTPNSISETSSASSDSEAPPQSSESPLTKSYDTLTGTTPVPEQVPPPPKPELPSQTSTLAQSSESSISTVISPLDNSYINGYSSHSSFAATANDNAGWSSTPNLRYSTEDRWNNSAGWGSHTVNGTMDMFGNGASSRPNNDGDDDDDDDDVPIAHKKQALVAAAAAAAGSASTTEAQEDNDVSGEPPLFIITVGDPQKVGDPVRPYITYTVHTKTTSPLYRSSAFSVLRRYSDFLWLYETLTLNYPGAIVPPVPEKQQYGRFEDTFVENRRSALNKCIQKIANHPLLRDDPDLKLFLESDSFVLDIKHRKAEIAHERGGLMASIGTTLVGPKFYETDEWFDTKKIYLDTLETQLRSLAKTIDAVTKQRNEVALSLNEFADNISALAACDVGKQLSGTLSLLAEVQKKAKDIQDLQAREDVAVLMSTVDEYARLVNSVRVAFSSRVRLYIHWQMMDNEMKKVQQAHEKARKQGKIPQDRVASSLSEVAEAERRAMEAKHDFDKASKTIKSEMVRFEQERVEDFKDSLVAFLEGMMQRQTEIIQAWESYQSILLSQVTNASAKQQGTTSLSSTAADM